MADEKMHAQIFHRRFVTSCSEMEISMLELAKRNCRRKTADKGRRLFVLLEADINELCEGADYIRKIYVEHARICVQLSTEKRCMQ